MFHILVVMTFEKMSQDERFMQRALELAELGRGAVSPNPIVGCVIVHESRIIGEGWHRKYGEAHAEVNAIQSVDTRSLLKEATAYVTLEPCSHFGKTPPCADLLIQSGIRRVVVANLDSNPLVSGNGIRKLQQAGIEVKTGVLEEQARRFNCRFFTFIEKQRPYIILKWAETADGFIARENYDSKWISGELSRKLVHKWRAEEDAIMIGTHTAHFDNPRLNVRDWSGKNPIRIAIDKQLRLSASLHLFDQSQPTILYNELRSEKAGQIDYVSIQPNTEIVTMISKDLYNRKVQSLLIEGGSLLLNSFIQLQLWDEIRIFRSKQTFGSGIKAPKFNGKQISHTQIDQDNLVCFSPVNAIG